MSVTDQIESRATAIGMWFAVIGLAGYLVVVCLALANIADFREMLLKNPAANIGIPCSGLAAYVLVSTLWKAFPPEKSDGQQLQLTVFGLEFTGPSGPITLWVVCFLAFILAVRTLMIEAP